MKVFGEGSIPSRILIVGEFPGDNARVPFDGAAGMELNRMLHETGIMRADCYTTLACKERPPRGLLNEWIALKKKDIGPQHSLLRNLYCTHQIHEGWAALQQEIEMVQPNIIIAMGNLACWMLSGNWGVSKWRGSLLEYRSIKLIPTLTPGMVLRDWPQRAVVLSDLRRVKRHMTTKTYDNKPDWKFIVRPSLDVTINTLQKLRCQAETCLNEIWIDFDIETRYGHIDCIGLS